MAAPSPAASARLSAIGLSSRARSGRTVDRRVKAQKTYREALLVFPQRTATWPLWLQVLGRSTWLPSPGTGTGQLCPQKCHTTATSAPEALCVGTLNCLLARLKPLMRCAACSSAACHHLRLSARGMYEKRKNPGTCTGLPFPFEDPPNKAC